MSIPTTRLGRTGLTVSRLALGTMTFGLQTDEAVSHSILDKATDGGINFLDTADVYPLGGTVGTTGRWTGQQVRPGKRGAIAMSAPSALAKLDVQPDRWLTRVKSIGSGYWWAVGEVQDLLEIAQRLGQRWLKGVGIAAKLA